MEYTTTELRNFILRQNYFSYNRNAYILLLLACGTIIGFWLELVTGWMGLTETTLSSLIKAYIYRAVLCSYNFIWHKNRSKILDFCQIYYAFFHSQHICTVGYMFKWRKLIKCEVNAKRFASLWPPLSILTVLCVFANGSLKNNLS